MADNPKWEEVTSETEFNDGDIIARYTKSYTGSAYTLPELQVSSFSTTFLKLEKLSFNSDTKEFLATPYYIKLNKNNVGSWYLIHPTDKGEVYIKAGDKKIEESTTDPNQSFSVSVDKENNNNIIISTESATVGKPYILQYNPNLTSSTISDPIAGARVTFYNKSVQQAVYAYRMIKEREPLTCKAPVFTMDGKPFANDTKSELQNLSVNLTGDNTTSVNELDDSQAPVRYYNVNGVELKGVPEHGIYIRVQGSKTSKVIL